MTRWQGPQDPKGQMNQSTNISANIAGNHVADHTAGLAAKAISKQREGRIRSRTLVVIRWFAIIGQFLTVTAVHFGLGYDLPIWWCLGIIAVSAWLNIIVTVRHPATKRLSERQAGLFLAYDTIQLAGLFYLTGGSENPFMLLFLVPVTISATILGRANTLVLGSLTVIMVSFLTAYHQPLPWHDELIRPALPDLYQFAQWGAIIVGCLFIGIYAWRISEESRKMRNALAATQLALSKEQRLSALGGLAAAAAHELGTPLGTITLIARELSHDLEESEYQDDLDILAEEAARCREILNNFSNRPDKEDIHFARAAFEGVVDEAVAPYKTSGKVVEVKVLGHRGKRRGLAAITDRGSEEQPYIIRHPEIIHGLGNFVENAVDFAKSRVEILLSWSDQKITVRINDDGPGFAPDILDKIGEPYVSTRRKENFEKRGQNPGEDGHQGMGLGVFIAKSLLERTGAEVSFANGANEGAVVAASWPRQLLEAQRPNDTVETSSAQD